MSRLILSFLFCLIFTTSAYSQPNNGLVGDVVMPPPNAASLGKYTDVPVDYASGLPSIGIPIHQIKEGPLSLAIGLSYHAGGMQVAQPASWVGLGWTLQGLGMVTRTVQGLPDEGTNGYRYRGAEAVNGNGDLAYTNYLIDIYAGIVDAEPDIFSFNGGNVSGKFFIDKLGNPQLIDVGKDIQIEYEYDANSYSKFIIIDSHGTRHYFGEADGITAYETIQAGNSGSNYRTNWLLLKIESSDRNYAINFTYTNESYSYKTLASGYHTKCTNSGLQTIASFPGSNGYDIPDHDYILQYVNGKRILSINSSTSVVEFKGGSPRQDLTMNGVNAVTLDSIRISSGVGTYCHEHVLAYSYAKDLSGSLPYYKRLILESVQELTCDGSDAKPAHTFTYSGPTNADGSLALPNRLTKAIDHWGYYNGKHTENENTDVNIPPTTVIYPPASGGIASYGSADRESYEEPMLRGALSRINYPTGGYTDFTFEANKILGTIYSGYTFVIPNLTTCASPGSTCCGTINQSGSYTFNSTDEIINAEFSLDGVNYYQDPTNGCGSTYRSVELIIEDSNGNDVGGLDFNFSASTGFYTLNNEMLIDWISGSLVPNQVYTFKIKSINCKATFSMRTRAGTTGDRIVGGLRIKEIKTYEKSGASPIRKSFKYTLSNTSSVSSGKLYREPSYAMYAAYLDDATGSNPEQIYYAKFFATSHVPLSEFDGRHLSYSKVIEDLNGLGRREYDFKFNVLMLSDIGNTYKFSEMEYSWSLPFFAAFSKDHGTPTSIKSFSESGVQVEDQSFTQAGYSNASTSSAIRLFGLNGYNGGSNSNTYNNIWVAYVYPLKYGAKLTGTVTTIKDGVTVSVSNTYDSQRRVHGPLSTQFFNSDGVLHETKYFYNYTYGATNIRGKMLDANLVGQPWKTENYVDNVKVGGSYISYALFSRSTGNVTSSTSNVDAKPRYYYNLESPYVNGSLGTQTWVRQTTISGYYGNSTSGKGYPISQTPIGWSSETYKWENGNITERKYLNYIWKYEYFPGTSMPSKITDIDGQYVKYEYDDFGRLKMAKSRFTGSVEQVSTAYTYQYIGSGVSKNYVKTKNTFASSPNSDIGVQETFQYLDGLGRPIQTVLKQKSSTGNDVVVAMDYDVFGRAFKSYEPVESIYSDGSYFGGGINSLFTLQEFESSPLSRVLKTTPPSWHSTIINYGTNLANTVKINGGTSYYPAGTLVKQTTTDPDGNKKVIYTDKLGRQILTSARNSSESTRADTYTIYDRKNRTIAVMPPGATDLSSPLNYKYEYTGFDAISKKWIPDQIGYTEYRYNSKRLVAATQDPMLRSNNDWVVNTYDSYGQMTINGIFKGTSPNLNYPTYTQQYGNTTYGVSGIEKGKVKTSRSLILDGVNTNWLEVTNFYDVFGRIERTEANNHLNINDATAEVSTMLYDNSDNLTVSTRIHKGYGNTISTTSRQTYDAWGRPKNSYHKLNSGAEQLLSNVNYTIKDQIAEQNIGGLGSAALQSIDFAYLPNGFLSTINQATLGGTNSAFSYCTNIPNPGTASANPDQNDLFYLDLRYDQLHPGLTGNARKNGNISQAVWRVRGRARQAYRFTYDFLNRLQYSYYYDINDAGTASYTNRFYERFDYADYRGNPSRVYRRGSYKSSPSASCFSNGYIDRLVYTYIPGTNKIQKIADNETGGGKPEGFNPGTAPTSAQYQYDNNGNMTTDPYKDLSIAYNYLNLPTTMDRPGANDVVVLYDAGGGKLKQTTTQNGIATTIDYLGGIEYVDGQLESIYHQAGRIVSNNGNNTSSGLRYEYNLTDHLGNVRLVISDLNGNGRIDQTTNAATNEVLQENHYYPFGMKHNGNWSQSSQGEDNRYRYNGKEFSEELGLYDYGLRYYDPAIGRWGAVDPLSEDYTPYSPYNYVLNSPVNAVDPNGGYAYFTNQRDAQRTADEWNIIYGARYAGQAGASNAFYVAEKQEWTVSTDGDGNLVIDVIKGTGEFRVMTNSEFDFNTDDYTAGLFDLLNTKDHNIQGSYGNSGELREGYGKTYSSSKFAMYSGLPNSEAGKNAWANDFATKGGKHGGTAEHTAGGIALHELLYHISPLGNRDESLPYNTELRGVNAWGPDAMRAHYGLRRTNPGTRQSHASGSSNIQFSRSEKERLDVLRARTGKK